MSPTDNRTVVADHFTDVQEFDDLLERAESKAEKSADVDFVAELRERYDAYLTRAYLSPRSLEKLRRIAGEA